MENPLCKYKDSLGKPNQGIHSYRFMGVAIVDVIFTILGAWLISYAWELNIWYCLLGLFLLGIFMHRLFCVKTKVDTLLFPIGTYGSSKTSLK